MHTPLEYIFAYSGFGPLAQLVEQGTFNPKVGGSSPPGPTIPESRGAQASFFIACPVHAGVSSNGRTLVFGASYRGSNPCTPAIPSSFPARPSQPDQTRRQTLCLVSRRTTRHVVRRSVWFSRRATRHVVRRTVWFASRTTRHGVRRAVWFGPDTASDEVSGLRLAVMMNFSVPAFRRSLWAISEYDVASKDLAYEDVRYRAIEVPVRDDWLCLRPDVRFDGLWRFGRTCSIMGAQGICGNMEPRRDERRRGGDRQRRA